MRLIVAAHVSEMWQCLGKFRLNIFISFSLTLLCELKRFYRIVCEDYDDNFWC